MPAAMPGHITSASCTSSDATAKIVTRVINGVPYPLPALRHPILQTILKNRKNSCLRKKRTGKE